MSKYIFNKIRCLKDPHGVVRIVFATVALGMGVNMKSVNTTWHYGAPSSLDDYLQESGRGGRSGEQANILETQRCTIA
jgi:superfamily II DNA helicase RecQ